jgi:5-formyltetrahydrofolate cyclo-ligase
MIATEKSEARARIRAEISALSAEYLAESDEGIRENLIALPEFQRAGNILFYFSIGREPDTRGLLRRALDLGKTVALPVTTADGSMTARAVTDVSDLAVRNLGIPEPDESRPPLEPGELDMIIVPAVAFDRGGYRLGRGGGYYDRYLARSRAVSVGLARAKLLQEGVPRETHDLPVNFVVTETGVFRIS